MKTKVKVIWKRKKQIQFFIDTFASRVSCYERHLTESLCRFCSKFNKSARFGVKLFWHVIDVTQSEISACVLLFFALFSFLISLSVTIHAHNMKIITLGDLLYLFKYFFSDCMSLFSSSSIAACLFILLACSRFLPFQNEAQSLYDLVRRQIDRQMNPLFCFCFCFWLNHISYLNLPFCSPLTLMLWYLSLGRDTGCIAPSN